MAEKDDYWSGLAERWLAHGAVMERITAPVGAALDAALALAAGEAVLDVGPGAGGSLLRFLDQVGPAGRVVGVDISPHFAKHARERAGCKVVHGDAGASPVEAGAFDAVASQLGMVFFADPAAAFRVVGCNLRPGGRLVFAAWGPRAQNPLFFVPGQVAAELLGAPPAADPDAPGPFGLQNASRTTALLTQAGFTEAHAMPVGLELAPGLGAEGFADVQVDVGPASARLREEGAGPAEFERVRAALAEAFSAFETEGELRLPAVANIYSAYWPEAETA